MHTTHHQFFGGIMKLSLGTIVLFISISLFISCSSDSSTAVEDQSSNVAEESSSSAESSSEAKPTPKESSSSAEPDESSSSSDGESSDESSEDVSSSEEVSSENESSSESSLDESSAKESSTVSSSSVESSEDQTNEIGDVDLKLKGDTLDLGGIVITGVKRVVTNKAASDDNPWMVAQLDVFPKSGAPVASIFYADLDSIHHVAYQILHMERNSSDVPIKQIDYQIDADKLLTQVGYQVLGVGQYLYFYPGGTADYTVDPTRVRYQPQTGGNIGCKDSDKAAATTDGCDHIATVADAITLAESFYMSDVVESSSSAQVVE